MLMYDIFLDDSTFADFLMTTKDLYLAMMVCYFDILGSNRLRIPSSKKILCALQTLVYTFSLRNLSIYNGLNSMFVLFSLHELYTLSKHF